jgi:hypothetical protein
MATNTTDTPDVEQGRSLRHRKTLRKPRWLKEKTINWGLQIAAMVLAFTFGWTAIVVAILFGVFTILAWIAGNDSVKQAQIANKLSLLSLCISTAVRIPLPGPYTSC